MFNEIVAVVVSAFNKLDSLLDKNGKQNVFLTPVAGKIPNQAMVITGTVAEKAGIEIGKTLLIMIGEKDPDPKHGRQFNHTVLGEVKPTEILNVRKELGTAQIVHTSPEKEGGNPDTGGVITPNAAATPKLENAGVAETQPVIPGEDVI